MDKVENPYSVLLERLHVLDQSIYVLNSVNNDLRRILHKQKPLPQFIHDSFKRPVIRKSKTSPALLLPPPTETEEMRLAANIIDKAKRTIENVGEKKVKQSSTVIAPVPTPVQSSTTTRNNRPKTSSSVRPSSAASSNIPPSSDSTSSQQPPVRRYVPAHMRAPFLTQPEKKRRPSSSIRNSTQINSNQRASAGRRSLSQQRRQSSSSSTLSIVELSQPTNEIPSMSPVQPEHSSMNDNQHINGTSHDSDDTPAITTTEELINFSDEIVELDISPIPQPIILNRALIKPLRRLWKQNQNLRLRLERELDKKSTSPPLFIDRVNEQIHSSTIPEEIRIPNIDVLLQLAMKLRAIVLYLLENSTFDNLDGALKRLHTMKYLVNRYHLFFTPNLNILVAKHLHRSSNINIEEWLTKTKSSAYNRNTVLYTDDGQLIAFTGVRFKQFENECRWIELSWHEQMILKFKQSFSNKDQNPLGIYRELMSLVTGLQTSTPIVVENRFE